MPFAYPAVQGTQRGQSFFLVTVPYAEISAITEVRNDIQRKLNDKRVQEIAEYLTTQNGCVPPVTLASNIPLTYRNGVVTWESDVLSVIDGQHRIAGIARALQMPGSEHLRSQQIGAYVLPAMQSNHQSQLFADLNGLMKPVNKAVRVAREFRDPAVVISRDVLFKIGWGGRVAFFSVSAIGTKHWAFTWLVEANRELLKSLQKTDEDNQIRILSTFWSAVGGALEPWLGQREYICSSSAAAMVLGLAGRHIITREDMGERISRLRNLNWARKGGDFENILVVGGRWLQHPNYSRATDLVLHGMGVNPVLPAASEVAAG